MKNIVALSVRYAPYLLVFNAIVAALTIASINLSPRSWNASAKLLLTNTNTGLNANLGTLGSLGNGETGTANQSNMINMQVSVLLSDALLKAVLDNDIEKSSFPSLADYRKLFKVKPQEQSTMIALTVTGSNEMIAQDRAKRLLDEYQQRLNQLRGTDKSARSQFWQNDLAAAEAKLQKAQNELTIFQQASGLINSEEQTKELTNTRSSLVTAKAQANAQAKASEAFTEKLSKRLSLSSEQAIRSLGLGENSQYQALQTRLLTVENALTEARSIYASNNPKVTALVQQQEELQAQIQSIVNNTASNVPIDTTIAGGKDGRSGLIQQLVTAEGEARSNSQRAQQLQKQIDDLDNSLKNLPKKQAKLASLQRQYEVQEGVYKGLVAQIQQSSINPFISYPDVQVFDPPSVDSKPSGASLPLILVNAILASVLGSAAIVLFLERRNPMLAPTDLQTVNLPTLACIPRGRLHTRSLLFTAEQEIACQQLASLMSLRTLRNRRLLITSATVGEGKTTVTLGLAIALVELGFKVLMVDGDFRKSELSATFCADRTENSSTPMSIQPKLDLLPAPTTLGKVLSLITQGQFETMLSKAQSHGNYDYVLIDSAPVNSTSETLMMAAMLGNVLLVVEPQVSRRNAVQESCARLNQHKANIIGAIVNGVETVSKAYLR